MDVREVWAKTAQTTKTTCAQVTTCATNIADELSPAFAPFAARWDQEADRRAQLRTPENLKRLMKTQAAHTSARSTAAQAKAQRKAAKAASNNPLNAARRAARTADKAASRTKDAARADLKSARKNYPQTLTRLAVKAHSVHAVAAGATSYVLSSAADWAVWPAATSASLIGLNVAGLWLGRRKVVAVVDEAMTAEEKRLASRLDPVFWVPNAEARGLSGTVPTPAQLTPAGLVSHVRLDDRWTPKGFRAKADEVRALLGARTDLRMEIKAGSHGDRATVTLRTRSASDGMSMVWTPDHDGIGVDVVTGEIVDVPLDGTHKLIAGVTNMGKSVSWRPWMMQAVADPLWAGILLDPKRLEARLWHGKIRTEGHQRGSNDEIRQAIYDAIRELVAEMQHRQEVADVTQWVPTLEYPNLLAVIEEGRQILQMAKDKRWADVLDLIDDLYTLARATGIWIIWATQYPSRTNGGVTAMVSENSLSVMSLTVDSPVSDRVVYGENAAASGWEPSKLGGIPGRALIKHKNRGPSPVQIWHVTDDVVAALPQVEPWEHGGPQRPSGLKLIKGEGIEAPAIPADLTENQRKVLRAIQGGASTNAEIAKDAEMNTGSVARAVTSLEKRGLVQKTGTEIRMAGAA